MRLEISEIGRSSASRSRWSASTRIHSSRAPTVSTSSTPARISPSRILTAQVLIVRSGRFPESTMRSRFS